MPSPERGRHREPAQLDLGNDKPLITRVAKWLALSAIGSMGVLGTYKITDGYEGSVSSETLPAASHAPSLEDVLQPPEEMKEIVIPKGLPGISLAIAERLRQDDQTIQENYLSREEALAEKEAILSDLKILFKAELQRPILTALVTFPSQANPEASDDASARAKIKMRILDLLRRTEPKYIKVLGLLDGTTVDGVDRPPMSNLPEIWEYKFRQKTDEQDKARVSMIKDSLTGLEHSVSLSDWYEAQIAFQEVLLENAEAFPFKVELIRYLTPEVMLATIHAEFFSELDGPTFIKLLPALFKGYNITFGPSLNDHILSSGPVQLTAKTFQDHILKNYTTNVLDVRGEWKEAGRTIIVPVHDTLEDTYDQQLIEAMVLEKDSVIFWSYLVALDHTQSGFYTLWKDDTFRELWDQSDEVEKITFLSALTPFAINAGGSVTFEAVKKLLEYMQDELAQGETLNLDGLATRLASDSTIPKPTALRGAKTGYATAQALFND